MPYRGQESPVHPSNSNALRHGLYARLHTTSSASALRASFNLKSKIKNSVPARTRQGIGDQQNLSPELLDHLLCSTRASLSAYLQSGPLHPQDLRRFLSWQRPVLSALRAIERQALASASLHSSRQDLSLAAAEPLRLIALSFQNRGITRDNEGYNYTVPTQAQSLSDSCLRTAGLSQVASGVRSDQKSSISNQQFLTDAQWEIVRPLLPPIHPGCSVDPESSSPDQKLEAFQSDQKSKIKNQCSSRGRPPADPRLLLDAIFWKLAFHARWSDVQRFAGAVHRSIPSPDAVLASGEGGRGVRPPSLLTIRRYYSRMYNSGRLLTIFSALYKHFRSAGGSSDLLPFLERESFVYDDHAFSLVPGRIRDWRSRTALLFFQLAFQSLRSFYRRQARRDQVPHSYIHLPRLKKDYSLALTLFLQNPEANSFQKKDEFSYFYSSLPSPSWWNTSLPRLLLSSSVVKPDSLGFLIEIDRSRSVGLRSPP